MDDGVGEGDEGALLVCSGSDEESTLVDLADAVVHGPDGVLEFLRQLMADIDTTR